MTRERRLEQWRRLPQMRLAAAEVILTIGLCADSGCVVGPRIDVESSSGEATKHQKSGTNPIGICKEEYENVR